MTVDLAAATLSPQQITAFARDGYVVVPGLFDAAELQTLITTCDELHAQGEIPGCFQALSPAETSDPLLLYPRMMQPHRVSRRALRYLLSPRWEPHLRALLGEAPIAAQSMFYWKPPGARGQALHQDNFYLKAYPGTCLAAWLAVDPADRENGGLFVVPAAMRWSSSARRRPIPPSRSPKNSCRSPRGCGRCRLISTLAMSYSSAAT